VPAASFDADRRITWLNAAARRIFGDDAVGRPVEEFHAPEARQAAEEVFTAQKFGARAVQFPSTMLDKEGRRIPSEINAVALHDGGKLIGVFGIVTAPGKLEPKLPPAQEPRLTPRQYDVLRLLGQGASTQQIADALGIQAETARNHIRALLKRLRQSSRVAAVAHARRHGLL